MGGELKRRPNLDHFRIRIGVEGDDEATRQQAIQLLTGATRIVDDQTFFDGENRAAFARFEAEFRNAGRGFIVQNPQILVNRKDLGRKGRRYAGIVAHHEAVEMLETGESMKRGDKFQEEGGFYFNPECHEVALVEEFTHAFERGMADEYLTFMVRRSKQLLAPEGRKVAVAENHRAYKEAKRRFGSRKRR